MTLGSAAAAGVRLIVWCRRASIRSKLTRIRVTDTELTAR
jgi:hypothetical protein